MKSYWSHYPLGELSLHFVNSTSINESFLLFSLKGMPETFLVYLWYLKAGFMKNWRRIFLYINKITSLPWRQRQDLGRTEFGKVFLDTVAKPIYHTNYTRHRISRITRWRLLKVSPYVLNMRPWKNTHPSFNYLIFPSPLIKLKLGLQIGGRLLLAKREQHSYHIY